MSNKFHRKLTDGELHRPERTGEGDPNEQSLFQVEDGQYYQDTLTGDVWRYVASSNAWELLLDYDRQNNLITNAQQRYDIKTQQIGELRSNIDAGSTVTSVDAYLFTQVRQGEDITVYQSGNTDNAISFTVTADNEGGDTTISVESERAFYDFLVGDPIKLDAGLLSAYQSADPTKIYSSISEERDRISLGLLSGTITKNSSVSSITITRKTSQTLQLRDSQFLYIYKNDGIGQFFQVDGEQTLNGFDVTVVVSAFTALYDYNDLGAFIVEPAWASTTQITQTANTVTILSQTVSETSNAVASINTRTGTLEASVNTIASVNDGQNTSITAINTIATNAYAAANLSVQYENATGYVKLLAGVNGSEITLQSNQININGLITAINDAGGVDADGTETILSDDAPNTRGSGATLLLGDIWIDTNAGDKPYVWRNTGSTEEWVAAYTQINGGDITTGTINASVVTVTNINASLINTGTLDVANLISANAITAEEINVANLLAQTLNVGNVIQSTNFDSNNGFAVYSNGKAYFRDVIIAGTSVTVNGNVTTGTGSNIDGTYVSNINAGNITAGTIDVNRLDVNSILAVDANISGNLSVTSGTIQLTGTQGGMEIKKISADTAGITGTEDLRLDGRSIDIRGVGAGSALQADEAGYVIISSGSGVQVGFFGSQGQGKSTITGNAPTGSAIKNLIAELDDHGLITDSTTDSAISLAHGGTGSSLSDPGGDEILYWNDTFNEVRWLDPAPPLNIAGDQLELYYGSGLTVASGQLKLANDITISGNVQASYKSDDGTAGISATRSWYDSAALETHNVVIKNGIITQWTVTS